MRIETNTAIYEDKYSQLVPRVINDKVTYECGCGEKYCYDMEIFSMPGTSSYQYNYTCGCGNRIKVYIKGQSEES